MSETTNPVKIGKYATEPDSSQYQNDPPQDFQPEQGLHDPDSTQQSRAQTEQGADRANQNSGEDMTESPEEA